MHAWTYWMMVVVTLAGARELDPSACATRFDVQRDKIIRTEESREMGARYLSELDVGSRTECLRLCCETDSCDVFVYEEKNQGSCYLFNCGPPEDFRCKFTAHSNFSSGVLALSRRLAELQDQERLAQHEQELTNLRVVKSTTSTTTTTITTPTAARVLERPAKPPRLQSSPPRRCSRYQFECHTGGECIAVYNACDGIPQCADGSDEAPELGCPTAPALPTRISPSTTTSTTTVKSMQVLQENAETPIADRIAVEGEHWPHRLTQAQPSHRDRFTDGSNIPSSHIFSHKGGLLQEPESGGPGLGLAAQYVPYEPPPWPRRPWQPQSVSGLDSIPEDQPWSNYAQQLDWPDPRRAWPVPQQRPESMMSMYMPAKTMPELPMSYSSQQQTLRDSPKKGFNLLKSPKESIEVITPSAPQQTPASSNGIDQREEKPPQKEKTNATSEKVEKEKRPAPTQLPTSSLVSEHEPKHEHFISPDDHDGLSEHPPAAVLLLVLGILMTAGMGAMLGCRARAVRRRLRRGGKAFAHDADYLVNGMYL